jgi:hypothetical protein
MKGFFDKGMSFTTDKRSLRVIVCLMFSGFLVVSPAWADVELVRDGASEYEIVLPEEPTRVERFAASELQHYLQLMTEAQLPISHSASGPSVLVGRTLAKRHGVSLTKARVGWDGFVMKTDGEHLILAGRNQRGTLYAVYALLEKQGVRWYAPNFEFYEGAKGGEKIPSRQSLRVESMDRVESPDYKYRKKYVEEGWTHTSENMVKLIDWMAKTRMNVFVHPTDYRNQGRVVWDEVRDQLTPELEKRGMILEVGGHGYQNYLPAEEYFDEHPKWFAIKNGERTRDENWVFNTANEEALDELTANVIDYLRAHPEIDIFDLWPPDGVRWSQDPQSLAQGSPDDRQAVVTNHVAKAVKEKIPGVKIEFIAYSASQHPPEKQKISAENTLMDFADYSRSYAYPIWDHRHPENAKFDNALKDWAQSDAFQGEISYYTYYRKYIWRSLPVVFPRLIQEEMQYYRQLGVVGLGSYSEPGDWFTYELNHYAIAKLSWDKDLNINRLTQDYVQKRFGPAAAPYLNRYFWLIEETVRKANRIPQTEPYDLDELQSYASNLDTCATLLRQARAASSDNSEAHSLLDKLELSLQYAALDLEIRMLNVQMSERHVAGGAQELETLRGQMRELFNANLDEGVFIRRGRYYEADEN